MIASDFEGVVEERIAKCAETLDLKAGEYAANYWPAGV